MARPTRDQALMPSLIDRLVDPYMMGSGMLAEFTPARMMESVRRDLEDLFNTHQAARPEVRESEALRPSILAYGLIDLPSISIADAGHERAVARFVEEAIAQHEPRLRDVRVVAAEPGPDSSRSIRLRIEARLNVEPSPEVELETILELTTGQATIRQARR